MGAKVKKNILKPIRYFSQMFDNKEPEMQIGLPTDVKHVAHIGSDGPAVNNAPGWMKEFHSAPLTAAGPQQKEPASTENLWGSQDFSRMEVPMSPDGSIDASESPTDDNSRAIVVANKPRRARRVNQSSDSNGNSDAESSSRRSRRYHKRESSGVAEGSDATSSSQNLPTIPKHTHRRKPKQESGNEASTKSSIRAQAKVEQEGYNMNKDLAAFC